MSGYFKFSRFKVFILIFLQQHHHVLGANQTHQITVFSDYSHQGKSAPLEISKCFDLPRDMIGQVTAVDTKGSCARLYAGKNCTGKSIEVTSRSPSHNNLGDWKFNDLMRSAGPCREVCNVNVTGPLPPKNGLNVSIYDRSNYQGATQVLNIQGCTAIPRKFNYRVLSINTTNNCFQLYNNVDCNSALTTVYDSIELRQGTPFHNDINRWHIPQIKAISHCSFKCLKNISHAAPTSSLLQPQQDNEVLLYDEPRFKGNVLKVDIKEDKKCVNLDQFNGWEGAAQSVKVFKNITSCFSLYPSLNCSGNKSLNLNATLQDMAARNFSAVTRSILYHAAPCGDFTTGATTASSQQQVSKASFRWDTLLFVVLGLIVGIFLLLLAVAKWWYPNMNVGNMIQVFRRNEISYLGALRL